MIDTQIARHRRSHWAFNLAAKSLVLLSMLVPMTHANTDQDATVIAITAAAPTAAIYLERFESLSSSERSDLSALQGSVIAMALFTKNCHWCHAQHRLLKKIVTTCPALRPVMVGIGERKQPLLRALRQSQNKFPAFLINRNLSNALDNLNVPKLLIFNAHGDAILQLDGHVPEAELITLLNRSAELEC